MRERRLFSRHVKFELVHISPLTNSLAYTEQVSCRSSSADEGTCRRDLSQLFIASCVSALNLSPTSFVLKRREARHVTYNEKAKNELQDGINCKQEVKRTSKKLTQCENF